MKYFLVDPMTPNLVGLQREGKLYWKDNAPKPNWIPPFAHMCQLSPQRRDFTEECLLKWATEGMLFTAA